MIVIFKFYSDVHRKCTPSVLLDAQDVKYIS